MPPTRRVAPVDIFEDATADINTYHFDAKTQAGPSQDFTSIFDTRVTGSQLSHATDTPLFAYPSDARPNSIRFEAPSEGAPTFSPVKQPSPPTIFTEHMLHHNMLNSNLLPPPMSRQPMTDTIPKKQAFGRIYQQVAPKLPPQAVFNTFSSTPKMSEKELDLPNAVSDPSSEPSYDLARYALGNNSLSEAIASRNGKRKKGLQEEIGTVPEPEDMPHIFDEPDGAKPTYSYSQLIGMAILRAPNRRLTLANIYKWISDTFSFYRNEGTGWMNSIRHNLSLNKSFYKQERPKDDPGKGNYWAIVEEDQKNYVRDKKAPKPLESNPSYFMPTSEPVVPFVDHFAVPAKPGRAVDSSKFPTIETSSDGTVPENEVDLSNDASTKDVITTQPVPFALPSSPPLLNMNSSPPIHRQTPPSQVHFALNTRSGDRVHRRKRTVDGSFKDSGFYSSINSSITRPGTVPAAPVGETGHRVENRPLKRGRAEEELARIRGSSFDPSPTRANKVLQKQQVPTTNVIGSSPLRFETAFAPYTPGMMLKAPTRAPATISPNTHLQRHRERVRALVGTPANSLKVVPGFTPFSARRNSPAFLLHHDYETDFLSHAARGEDKEFEDGADLHALAESQSRRNSLYAPTPDHYAEKFDLTSLYTPDVSPLKHVNSGVPTKQTRPTMQRAVTATNALADITRSHNNSTRLASPFNFEKSQRGVQNHESPLGRRKISFTADDEDSFWSHDVFVSDDENAVEHAAPLDLMKGFGQIGRGKENAGMSLQPGKSAPRNGHLTAARPAFGRSMTNLL